MADVEARWVAKETADGRVFYYNRSTKERTWRRPAELGSAKQTSLRKSGGKHGGSSDAASAGVLEEKLRRVQLERAPSESSECGRGREPEMGDTGTSAEGGFVVDGDGYLNRVDGLEREYLAVDGAAALYRHRFTIKAASEAAADVRPEQLREAASVLPPPPPPPQRGRRRSSSEPAAPPPPGGAAARLAGTPTPPPRAPAAPHGAAVRRREHESASSSTAPAARSSAAAAAGEARRRADEHAVAGDDEDEWL